MAKTYPDDHAIWQLAVAHGLRPCPVIFEPVPASVLYEHAAYLIPGRMAHWSFGKQYQLLKTRYDYGLGKLYEMVVNTNPAYAFLLASNSSLENTVIRCHVMGHVDFFQANQAFSHTPKNMIDVVSHHADRIRQYEFQYGKNVVESFLDHVLAIEEHVDWDRPARRGFSSVANVQTPPEKSIRPRYEDLSPTTSAPSKSSPSRPLPRPTFDLLGFLMTSSDALEDWQRDIIGMVREEMRYLWPQLRTKIINEGWATYWHLRLMREISLADDDWVDFARMHALVVAPQEFQVNPYALGSRIFESIWQKGGDEALFLAREVEEDTSFLRNHLSPELVQAMHLFVAEREHQEIFVHTVDGKAVRDLLIHDLMHGGIPVISVDDGDFHHRGELLLRHHHDGSDLDIRYAEETLRHVYRLWGRPVHLETVVAERQVRLSCDQDEVTKATL